MIEDYLRTTTVTSNSDLNSLLHAVPNDRQSECGAIHKRSITLKSRRPLRVDATIEAAYGKMLNIPMSKASRVRSRIERPASGRFSTE